MSKILFIQGNHPAVETHAWGEAEYQLIERRLILDTTTDTALVTRLTAMGYEQIDPEDDRYEWIMAQGWSRQSQRDFERRPQ